MPRSSAVGRRLLYIDNTAWHFVNHRQGLAREARKAGYEVHLAVPSGDEVPSGLGNQVRVHRYPLSRRGINPLAELRTLASLVGIIRRLRPSLIHCLTLKPVLYGTMAGLSVPRTPIVNGVTGLGFLFSAQAARYRAVRRALMSALTLASRSSRVSYIFQHPGDVEVFQSAGVLRPGNHEIIPGSGVDMADFDGVAENQGPRAVLMASRLLWDKGVEEYVGAARLLRSRGIASRFILAGDSDPGNPESIPRDTIEAWNREGVIEWVGWQSDIRKMLAQADVVCLPSRDREGIPRILLEAAASGRAIVTTDVPGCRDVVLETGAGRLVPPRDSSGLANAVAGLLENAAERAAMGKRAREGARKIYSQERVNGATLDLYERLLVPKACQ